jgi:hypothetical protein
VCSTTELRSHREEPAGFEPAPQRLR